MADPNHNPNWPPPPAAAVNHNELDIAKSLGKNLVGMASFTMASKNAAMQAALDNAYRELLHPGQCFGEGDKALIMGILGIETDKKFDDMVASFKARNQRYDEKSMTFYQHMGRKSVVKPVAHLVRENMEVGTLGVSKKTAAKVSALHKASLDLTGDALTRADGRARQQEAMKFAVGFLATINSPNAKAERTPFNGRATTRKKDELVGRVKKRSRSKTRTVPPPVDETGEEEDGEDDEAE